MPDQSTVAAMVKPYTDYLDKEMTIQGVLSAFCVAAAGLFGDKVLGAAGTAEGKETFLRLLQMTAYPYVVATIIALILAASLFYAQRSYLALLLGQISLAVTRLADDRPPHKDELTVFEWIDDADSWTTWSRYRTGLASLVVAAVECLLALVAVKISWVQEAWPIAVIPFLLAALSMAVHLKAIAKRDALEPVRRPLGLRRNSRKRRGDSGGQASSG